MSKRIITNRSVAPYYDDYDSSKQYTHLLAVPGRVAQAREITQIQSTVKDIIKSVGDSFLKDGNLIEGCQVLVADNKKSVTVTSGKIYMQGMVLPVQESTIDITGVGTETVGAKLVEYLITEQEDSSLKDPAQGYDNFNQPGCHRIQSTIAIVLNDPEAAVISNLVDGQPSIERYAPEYDTLTQTLARRTYDESGSYIVDGLEVRVESYDNDYYNVVVESGKAYILGYELKIPTARRLKASRAVTYSPVVSRRTYSISGSQEFSLYNGLPYVRDIIDVVGIKKITEDHSIPTNVSLVSLNQSDVYRVLKVYQGSTEYTQGTGPNDGDFYVTQSGTTYYLKWNGTSHYPVGTFRVEYEYYKVYQNNVDYELIDHSTLKWKSSGDHPEDNTVFTVDFNQYLARKDVVYMDRYGVITDLEGVPAEYSKEVAPEIPLNTLALAVINNPPNGSVTGSGDVITVKDVGLTRFTMNDIQSLLNRLNTIEYDQAILSLNNEAKDDETVGKKGIYTDPLIDVSRIDFYYNRNSSGTIIDPSKPAFDMALDLLTNIAYLPIISHTNDVSYNNSSSSKRHDRLITLNTTGERVLLSQMNATKSFLINPYSMFPQMPEVTVNPSVDSWIEDTVIEVPISLTNSSIVSMSTRTIDTRSSRQVNNWNYSSRTSTNVADTAIGTRTTTYSNESIISERAVTYIRRRTLTVEGSDFPSNLDNIKCYFDGVLVSLTPASGTSAGTQSGTVKANENGYVKATFMIPANILTGTREVVLKSDTTVEGYVTEGFTLYVAQGNARTIQRTVTTLTTVLLQRTTTTTITAVYVDPVGQTFVLDKMSMIKGIDLYFESKPSTNAPVICEIRGVSNGSITSQVYAHASLSASQVQVSPTAATATRFNFSDPVLLEENTEYAFVVRSMSDEYRIWVAEIGGTEISTVGTTNPQLVLKNPYMTGVMMSSSNNSTWTAHQTTDMKFRLVENTYAMSSVAQFNSLSVADFSRIYLSADSAIPSGTTLNWSYSLDGTNYTALSPYSIVNLNEIKTNITLRASLSRESSINLSPMIALDTVDLTTSCYDTKGAYVMNNISGLDPDDGFTDLKIILDVYEPTGTSINVKFSTNDGATIQSATKQPATKTMNYNWKEVIYTATVSPSTQCKIFVEATSNSKAATPAFRKLRAILS